LKITMKKNRVIAIVVAVLVIAGLVVAAKVRSANNNKPAIETAKVERGTVVKSVSASGVLQPLTTVDVKSNAAGEVKMLAVDVGDVVKPGQLIAKIDPTDSITSLEQATADLDAAQARVIQAKESKLLQVEQNDAQIQQAEAAYRAAKIKLAQAEAQAKAQPVLTKTSIAQAQANLDSAKESLRQLKEAGVPQGIAQAKAAYEQAKAAFDKAERNYNRQVELFKKGFISAGQLDSAESDYRTAKAQVESAKERVDTQMQDYDSQLKSAEAKVSQAEAALENAKANAIQDSIRQQDVIAAREALKQAESALLIAKSNVRQNIIKAEDIKSAMSSIVKNKAQVNNARVQLNYTTVTAPRAGVILQKYVEAGTIVTSGKSSFAGTGAGTSIVQLGDLSRMFVLASVDEADIAQIEVGQQVDITLDAYPDEIFEGKVTKIDPQTVTEQNVTTVPVTVEIENPDARLKPGMNANCEFIVERRENVLVVPTDAVKEDNGKYTVQVVKDGKLVTRRVEVGLAGDETTEIVSGLKEGEDVVTSIIEPTTSTTGTTGRPGGFGFGGGMRPR